jgi:small acid-soluble spore protein I (minor)
MIMSLREAIVRRLQDKSSEELQDVIESSIGHDERTLPGLGVIFEIIWQHSGEDLHNQLVTTLKDHLPQGQTS